MYDVFRQSTAVNHNIGKVYDDEFVFHWLQDAVHHTDELAGCVRLAKRQDSPLIQTKFSGESRLLTVGCCNTNLMVTSCQVSFCETAGAVHGVE